MSRGARAVVFAAFVAAVIPLASCHSTVDCSNGTCACASDDHCEFACGAPPCHVDCASGSTCSGTCSNGTCTCQRGASCAFECGAPPCHVACEGQNATCSGSCSNGTCTCGAGSQCAFRCLSGPCHATCAPGASCVVECPNGLAGSQDCDIVECASGPVVCGGGAATVCNAPCPGD
jgi:hypothetical protein